MAKKFDCPIEGCERRANNQETLNSHLYTDHRKNEIAATVIVLMDLVTDLQAELRDIKWKFRTHE